jgi:hypothetical protein
LQRPVNGHLDRGPKGEELPELVPAIGALGGQSAADLEGHTERVCRGQEIGRDLIARPAIDLSLSYLEPDVRETWHGYTDRTRSVVPAL